jgi:ABC-type multidrug transport system fused ATPase/permease subunit
MFWDNRQTQEKYYIFLKKLFRFDKTMRLIEVDFHKPWWFLLWQQKGIVLLNVLNVLIYSSITSLAPFLLAQVYISGNIKVFILFVLGLIFIKIINYFLFYFDPVLRLQSSKSIENSATQFFLTVDPTFHSLRSSGQIVSKVNRGSSAFESLIDIMSFNLLSLIGMMSGLIIAFAQINLGLAFAILIFLILLIVFSIFLFVARSKLLKKNRIQNEDKSKALNLETLQQATYIRAVFGTKEQIDKAQKAQFKSMTTMAVMWESGGTIVSISQIIFLISMIYVGMVLFSQANLDKTIAVSLILSYYQLHTQISFVGNSFGRVINNFEDIKDLFEFIRNFGKQSFPVLK